MNLDGAAEYELALTVACPSAPAGCLAPINDPCRNLRTGLPLSVLPAHIARMRLAGIRYAPSDLDDLAARGETTPAHPGRRSPRPSDRYGESR